MSKKISSIVTSIAGVMVAIPTTSDANIATTGYVNKIVNQTHAVGSALQFGLLSDNATPLFMLGATNQPTTGANGGSLVGSYGAISVEKLALALTPKLMGSAITGFITGSGSHVLVGDGTTTGTAGWTSLSTIGPKIAGFETNKPYESATGFSQILMQGDASGHAVYYPTNRFTVEYVKGAYIDEFPIGSGSHVLVGDGTTSGTAGWSSVNNMLTQLPDFLYNGELQRVGEFKMLTYYHPDHEDAPQVSWEDPRGFLANLYRDRGWPVISPVNTTGVTHILAGTPEVNNSSNMGNGHAAWTPLSALGTQMTYGTATGSFVLVGSTTTGTAGWSSVEDMLKNGLGEGVAPDAFAVPVHLANKDIVRWEHPSFFTEYMVVGSKIAGYTTGSGSYVLAGDGSTSSTAKWAPLSSLLSFSVVPGFNINQQSLTNDKDIWIPAHISALGSQPTTGDQINGYASLSEAGRYIGGYRVVSGSALLANTGSTILSYQKSNAEPNGEAGKIYQTFMQNERIYGVEGGGSLISGFATGSGSYVLVGDGTTSGTAAWSSVSDIVLNAPYSTTTRDFNNVLVNQEGNGTRTNLKMPKTTFGSLISPHIQGSAISGYTTGSGAPTYILGTNTTGAVTGATMQLHAISGLGSEIKFTETKTAAEISASTGTVYFPVIQNGQIYGVTLNDFYILMNAKF